MNGSMNEKNKGTGDKDKIKMETVMEVELNK